MGRLPLTQLQGFLAAARLRNLSRAAESLHLTVSALSHQIRALEERLDQRLFTRGARGVSLTADGERLHDAVATHFDAIEHALRPGVSRRDDVLTVSLLPSLASSWLVPRLSEFLTANPQLEINLQSSVSVIDFDRERGIDAALRFGPGNWPGVTAVHLFDDWIAPVASPALIAAHGRGGSTDDLSRYPLLGDPGRRWTEWFKRFGGTAPKRFVAGFDDTETLQRAAVADMGVALARLTLSRPLVDAGLLVVLSPHRLKSDYAHYLVYPPRSADHAGLLAFRDWLLAKARDYALTLDEETSAGIRSRRRQTRGRDES